MAVFAYSPAVQLLVKKLSDNKVYDVSADMVRGQAILRSNAPHQISFTLMNKNRRYDTLFAPNDLFTLYMKRTRKLLVMSGYLDSVPWYSTWERSGAFYGTCTTKRLLQKRWDPGTIAALQMMSSAGSSQAQLRADGGMASKAVDLITQVGGWPIETVHVAALPLQWALNIQKLYEAASPLLLGNMWGTIGATAKLGTKNSPVAGSTSVPQSPPSGLSSSDQVYFSLPGSANAVGAVPYSGKFDVATPTSSYYCQMNWGYLYPGVSSSLRSAIKGWLAAQAGPVMVYSPTTNKSVLCQIVGDGPGPLSPNDVKIGLSPAALDALGIKGTGGVNNAPANTVFCYWCDQKTTNVYTPGPWPSVTSTSIGRSAPGRLPVTTVTPASTVNNPLDTPQISTTNQGDQVAQYCLNAVGDYYKWSYTGGVINGRPAYDCSGLAVAAWKSVGVDFGDTRSTEDQWASSNISKFTDQSQLIPGDLVYYDVFGDKQAPPNHMGVFVEVDGSGVYWTVQATSPTTGVQRVALDAYPSSMQVMGYGRPTGMPGYTAAPSSSMAGSSNMGIAFGSGVTTATQTPTSFINYWDWFGQPPQAESQLLTGIRGLLNDQPLLPFINTVLNSSMRSWCSAPNGDFISWFPDYFGLYGMAGIINVEDIELQDFSMSWSDTNMVTHQYVASSWVSQVFGASPAGQVNINNITNTEGVVSLEMGNLSNNILQVVLGLKPGDASGFGNPQALLDRFGARPNFQQIGVIMGPMAQFWYALFLFQLNWASMFSVNVPMTFMPEVFPGMLMRLRDGFQAYIQQVIHTWDLTSGGPGFQTQAAVMAPSDWRGSGLYGLPAGGKRAVV